MCSGITGTLLTREFSARGILIDNFSEVTKSKPNLIPADTFGNGLSDINNVPVENRQVLFGIWSRDGEDDQGALRETCLIRCDCPIQGQGISAYPKYSFCRRIK